MMERMVSDMGKTVKLLINHYIGNDFITRTQMFNPDMAADQIATKGNYYWTAYVQ